LILNTTIISQQLEISLSSFSLQAQVHKICYLPDNRSTGLKKKRKGKHKLSRDCSYI